MANQNRKSASETSDAVCRDNFSDPVARTELLRIRAADRVGRPDKPPRWEAPNTSASRSRRHRPTER